MTCSGVTPKNRRHRSSNIPVSGGTTEQMHAAVMSVVAIPRNSSRFFSRIPYSSAIRRESVATRSVVASRSIGLAPFPIPSMAPPSRNAPMVTAVLPMSIVSSISIQLSNEIQKLNSSAAL